MQPQKLDSESDLSIDSEENNSIPIQMFQNIPHVQAQSLLKPTERPKNIPHVQAQSLLKPTERPKNIPHIQAQSLLKPTERPKNISHVQGQSLLKSTQMFKTIPHVQGQSLLKPTEMFQNIPHVQGQSLLNPTYKNQQFGFQSTNAQTKKSSAILPQWISCISQQCKDIQESKYSLDKLLQLENQDRMKFIKVIDRFMCEIPSQQKMAESQAYYQQLLKNEKDDQYLPIFALGQLIKKIGSVPIYTRKSTLKTRLSLMLLNTNIESTREIYLEHFKQKKNYSYQQIYRDSSRNKLQKFIKKFKNRTSKKYGLPIQSIYVHCIFKGSIKILWETSAALPDRHPSIILHPYFKYFQLSPDDFDSKGNNTYDKQSKCQLRGGVPYFFPKLSKKYGLRVLDLYQSNQWLSMDTQNKRAWASIFHGVSNPNKENQINDQKIKTLNSIMNGLKQGTMLIPGPRQLHNQQKYKCINKKDKVMPVGVYVTPSFRTAIDFTNNIKVKRYRNGQQYQQSYRLVFQCRVKPQSIHVSQEKNRYWVIEESKNIRPYGIILIKEQNINQIIQNDKQKKQDSSQQDQSIKEFNWKFHQYFWMIQEQ